MAAKIIRSEVLKSINHTMTVVEINRTAGGYMGRVLFADSFGNVQRKREFFTPRAMEEFVAEQLSLEHDWRCANPTA